MATALVQGSQRKVFVRVVVVVVVVILLFLFVCLLNLAQERLKGKVIDVGVRICNHIWENRPVSEKIRHCVRTEIIVQKPATLIEIKKIEAHFTRQSVGSASKLDSSIFT